MFCFKCGAQLPDGSVFCPQCGAKVEVATSETPSATTQKYKVVIDRASQLYLINPSIKVTIDNRIRMTLENGETQETELEAGNHVIECTSSMRTTKKEFDLSVDTLIKIGFSRLSGKITMDITPL